MYFLRLILAVMLFFSYLAHAKAPIQMVYFDNFSPFSWKENEKMMGITVDIVDEVFKRLNIAVKHDGYPWNRAQEFVRTGDADAFVTFPSEARLKYTVSSSEEILSLNVTLFTYKNHPKIHQIKLVKNLQDLSDFEIVDYTGNGWAKNNLKDLKVKWLTTIDQTSRFLSAGRTDVRVANSYVTYYHLKYLDIDNLIEVPVVFDSINHHFCIGKNSPYVNIIPEFDATIRKMKQDGTLSAIKAKYR